MVDKEKDKKRVNFLYFIQFYKDLIKTVFHL